jgi:PAS domain-containing protein
MTNMTSKPTVTGAVEHPDDSKRIQALWDRAMTNGSAFEMEVRMRKGDGTYHWFLARWNPVRDDKGQILRWYKNFFPRNPRLTFEEAGRFA